MEYIKNPRKIWSYVKEVRKTLKNWDTLTTAKQCEHLYEMTNLSGILVGVRALYDGRINISSFYCAFIIIMYYTLAMYTTYVRTINGRLQEGITCWSIFGLYTSVNIHFGFIDEIDFHSLCICIL